MKWFLIRFFDDEASAYVSILSSLVWMNGNVEMPANSRKISHERRGSGTHETYQSSLWRRMATPPRTQFSCGAFVFRVARHTYVGPLKDVIYTGQL